MKTQDNTASVLESSFSRVLLDLWFSIQCYIGHWPRYLTFYIHCLLTIDIPYLWADVHAEIPARPTKTLSPSKRSPIFYTWSLRHLRETSGVLGQRNHLAPTLVYLQAPNCLVLKRPEKLGTKHFLESLNDKSFVEVPRTSCQLLRIDARVDYTCHAGPNFGFYIMSNS